MGPFEMPCTWTREDEIESLRDGLYLLKEKYYNLTRESEIKIGNLGASIKNLEFSLIEVRNQLAFACAVIENIYDILSGLGWPEINIHDFLPIIKSVNHQQYGLKENPLEKWYAAKERKESV